MKNNQFSPFIYVSESDSKNDESKEERLARSIEFVDVISSSPGLLLLGAVANAVAKGVNVANDSDANISSKKTPTIKPVPDKAFAGNAVSKRLATASGLAVMTLIELKNEDVRFPPGHPVPGKLYRLHPLSENSYLGKENVYIPSWSYDEVMYCEREAELIRLLVCLGAIKISIRKVSLSSDERLDKMSGDVAVAGGVASVAANYEGGNKSEKLSSDVRTFVLEGRPWKVGDKLDVNAFGWLPYEPSWGTIVQAREIGGCLKAMIELNLKSAFSSESLIEASLNYGVNSAKGRKNSSASGSADKSYIIEVEFCRKENV